MYTLDELVEKLLDRYDPDDIIDLLGITSEDLLEQFQHRIADNYDKVTEAVEYDELG